ncbi:Hypothetical protein R9X50_00736100 [Acrodontium crateriforme]|uniref:Box C/D snoRNA protein 1 n=1 Tax=Acrodontium crateriforme TaxID=150365 RepID=A0AAQ3RCQ4_9PEZI|nr:Hypothetical protein R9X50_00736100 [Acrodontium crateriforme]
MSGQAALLSDLCSICYTEPPKYKCPRCKTQTCSLPCYKKHQQRASCSGKRDPAAYLKKSEWATPSGIDQDYNYLKSVERTIDHAGQDASARGIGVSASVSKNVARGRRPESMLQRYLQENRITVERAPVGMSRQKANLTRPTKRNHVVWTVEWIDVDGSRTVQNDCLESASMLELYESLQIEKRNARQRVADGHGDDSSQRGVKRKRNEINPEDHKGQTAESTSDESKGEQAIAHPSAISTTSPNPITSITPENDAVPKPNPNPEIETQEPPQSNSSTQESRQEPPCPPSTTQDSPQTSLHHPKTFHLLRPQTKGPSKILIPLSSTATLTLNLQNRTVQEFPTIIVLNAGLDRLPEGYLLEAEYEASLAGTMGKGKGKGKARGEGEGDENGKGNGNGEERERPKSSFENNGDVVAELDERVDAQGILDMLRRDVGV